MKENSLRPSVTADDQTNQRIWTAYKILAKGMQQCLDEMKNLEKYLLNKNPL